MDVDVEMSDGDTDVDAVVVDELDVDVDDDVDGAVELSPPMDGNDVAMAVTACVNDDIILNNDFNGRDEVTAVVTAAALDSLNCC